jgi:hypothetical protein
LNTLEFHIGERLTVTNSDGAPPKFSTTHEEVLLAALLLAKPHELSRASVSKSLWPDSTERLALQSLRQRVASINARYHHLIDADRRSLLVGKPVGVLLDQQSELPPDSVLNRARRLVAQCGHNGESETEHSVDQILKLSSEGKIFVAQGSPKLIELALDRQLAIHERLDSAVALLASPKFLISREETLQLAREMSFASVKDRKSKECQWFTCQIGSTVSHQAGQWSRALMFQRRALELAHQLRDSDRIGWSKFRSTRVDIDMGISSKNSAALAEMSGDDSLSPRLRALVEVNLVFTYAAASQASEVQNSVDFCRRSEIVRSEWGFASWLCLNEAMSWILLRQPQKGIDALVEAAKLTDGKMDSIQGTWHWMVAAQLFGAMGHSKLAAELSTMVDRGIKALGSHVSPVNSRIYNSIIAQVTRASHPADWLSASESVSKLPLGDLHPLYVSRLKEAAREFC